MYNESEVNHKHPSCFLYHFTLNSKSNHEYTVHAECVRKSNTNFLSFMFNEIAKSHEKLGGRARPENQMKEFREALDVCCLADLGYRGAKYTWYKKLTGGITVWEHLDRAVVNSEWISLFPGSVVTHLDAIFSDHKPLLI